MFFQTEANGFSNSSGQVRKDTRIQDKIFNENDGITSFSTTGFKKLVSLLINV